MINVKMQKKILMVLRIMMERQTLTRLPATGAVLFTILTFIAPLAAVAARPDLGAKLAARVRELPLAMLAYKNLATNRDAIVAYLDGR